MWLRLLLKQHHKISAARLVRGFVCRFAGKDREINAVVLNEDSKYCSAGWPMFFEKIWFVELAIHNFCFSGRSSDVEGWWRLDMWNQVGDNRVYTEGRYEAIRASFPTSLMTTPSSFREFHDFIKKKCPGCRSPREIGVTSWQGCDVVMTPAWWPDDGSHTVGQTGCQLCGVTRIRKTIRLT